MRGIKFRGKSIMSIEELDRLEIEHKNGWVYGNLISNGNNPYIVGDVADAGEEYITHYYWAKVIPETVSQLTCIRDKNSVEIYEGSILSFPEGVLSIDEKRGVVEWDEKSYVVRNNASRYMLDYPYRQVELWDWSSNAVVIGNVYDNYELLKTE